MSEFMYLTIQSPTLTIGLAGKDWRAENGVLKLSEAAAAELDTLMKERPDLRAHIRKVDMDEAARKAKAFLTAQPPAAIKGPVTSGTSAAAKLREAREAQRSENLTGQMNAVNVKTNAQDSKPLAVEQIPVDAPKKASFGKLVKP